MKTLITQSLLASFGYMFECPDEYADDAESDFIRTLNREPAEPTQAMQNGIDFERDVYRMADGQQPSAARWATGAGKIADIIRGSQIQVRMQREIRVNGNDYLVYGIADAIHAGTIYDVKYSNRSFGSVDLYGKYNESPQHPAYFYLCPEAEKFQYIVSDGRDIYIETYEPQTSVGIWLFIEEFANYIEKYGLADIYRTKWGAKEC